MRNYILFSLLFIFFFSFSQDKKAILAEIQNYESEKQQRIENFLANNKTFDRSKVNRIFDIINGKPILVEAENLIPSIATRTNHLQPDGSLNLDLTGEDLVMGIWEVDGIPQFDHQEFTDDEGNSRVQIIDNVGTDTHATHVAGTLIAKGNLASARGMAVKASLVAYDNLDDIQESFFEASDNDLLVSNYSYGVPVNAFIGANAEWEIGAYRLQSRLWDLITYSNPYLLPVVSAGNSGLTEYEGGIGTGFDKLSYSKVSKNLLIVANASNVGVVEDTGEFFFANINPSSSQGPTDDGRIKPDITGYGTNVLSTFPGGGYGNLTGTSMSAPNIAGSALLLQELYFDFNNNYMLSQTLKGLICATANDAGQEGPDQKSGWGLMNSKRAAEAILDNGTNDIILENTLISGESNTIRINYESGDPLTVALSWTDPAGNVENPGVFNDPTPKLMHDLDVRVVNADSGVESLPWKLDLNDLTAPAIIGDNTVDNIEIIEIDQPGVYDIVVSHKDDLLVNSQSYSLIALNAEEVPLSFEEFDKAKLQLWPNPADNLLNISTANDFNSNIQIKVIDMLGRTILSNTVQSATNTSLDISGLNKGLYIIELNDGELSIREKFLKK